MIELLSPSIVATRARDGVVYSSTTPLPTPPESVNEWLIEHARRSPERVWLAERAEQGLRTVTYRAALDVVRSLAGALPEAGVTPKRPLLVLSDNSVDAALLELACMHAGVPIAFVSSAYSLQSKDHARLIALVEQLEPSFVWADDARYERAIAAIGVPRWTLRDGAPIDAPRGRPDTVAKILFTSGSTGSPKGIVNTQRMLTSNQESLAACWSFLRTRPPVIVDWLPWSHTFGSNHNFFMVLRNGGTLHVDRGRPTPELVGTTLANMAEVGPTLWVNVPRGFDQALPLLEADEALARRVFRNLDLVFYAAAALRPSTRERLQRVAARAGRPDLFFTSAWGSTETAPLSTSAHFVSEEPALLGVPVPGVDVKLSDEGELRVRGPNVTPGAWSRGEVVPTALDEEGFLPTGDAGRLAEPNHPERGLVFGGRIGENFKLSSGTWVSTGALRIALVEALAPVVLDAVLCGHDGEHVCALVVLNAAGAAMRDVDAHLERALAAYNAERPGASQRVERLLVLDRPLSLDEGETTDKGYTNQRRVLERRAHDVTRLLASTKRVLR